MKNIIYIFLLFVFGTTFAQDYLEEEQSGYKGGFIPELKVLDKSLNFIVMGDFGRNGQYFQK